MGKNKLLQGRSVDAMCTEPNEETKAAIEEARIGKNLKNVDTSSLENFIESCSE